MLGEKQILLTLWWEDKEGILYHMPQGEAL